MTIKYLDSKRIRGSSTAEKTPDYSTTFASSDSGDWTSSTTHLVYNGSGNRITFECDDNSTAEFINHDMGATNISNTAWILRYEMTFSTFNMSQADVNNTLLVGCLDNASPSGIVPSGDGITYNIQVSDSAHTIANVLSAINGGSQSKADVNNDPFDEDDIGDYITTFYVEIKRVSADLIEQRVYTTSDYSTTQLGTTMSRSTSSAVTALRYITILLNTGVHNSDGYTGYIQNLKFWNDQTTTVQDDKATLVTAAVTPTRQSSNMDSTEFATVSDDKFQFTLPSTTGTMPSTATGYGGDTMTFDLGSALSDTAWVARCKVTFTTMDLNDVDSSMNGFGFWISDTANGNVDVGSQDWASIVGMRVQNADGNTSTGAMMGGRIRDNNQPETHFSTGDSNCPLVGTSAFSATTYYIQTTRDDDDLTTTIGTDSYGGTVGGGEQLVTQANVTGLRYLKFTVFSEFRSAGDPDGTVIGNIDDFSIDDGVTTYGASGYTRKTQAALLSGSSDLPENTLFEETDTYSTFWLQSNKWYPLPVRGCFTQQASDDNIQYMNPDSLGNAITFGITGIGNLSGGGSFADANYGVVFGNGDGDVSRFNMWSIGNGTDWGQLSDARWDIAGCSSATRGLAGGGAYSSTVKNVIDYITIAGGGGTFSDFGDLSQARYGIASLASATRGVFAGGYNGGILSRQDFVTIASAGNASQSGALDGSRWLLTGCSNDTIGFWAGGHNASNTISKITIASLGTAADYGDLSVGRHQCGSMGVANRAIFGGGNTSNTLMDYKAFDSSATATTFGTLTTGGTMVGTCTYVRT